MILTPYDALRGRRVADVVRSVDVMPTVLDLLGLPLGDTMDGRSVVPLMTGAVREMGLAAYAEAVYPRYHYGWSDLRSLTSGRFKYIEAPRPELYDLVDDPNETRNLYDERQLALARSHGRDPHDRSKPAGSATSQPAADVDPDARARLAALGYVGTFAASTTGDRSATRRSEGQDRAVQPVMTAREQLHDEHDSDGGLKALREVVAKDPNRSSTPG